MPVASFFVGCLDDGGGQEVETAEVVFFAALVEDSPCAALGHVLYFWEGVEVWEVGIVCHFGGWICV